MVARKNKKQSWCVSKVLGSTRHNVISLLVSCCLLLLKLSVVTFVVVANNVLEMSALQVQGKECLSLFFFKKRKTNFISEIIKLILGL